MYAGVVRGGICFALLLVAAPASAQKKAKGSTATMDEIDAALAETAPEAEPEEGARPAAPAKKAEDLPEIGEDRLAVFKLDRGFYLSSDLGMFFSLKPAVAYGSASQSAGISNLQPYISLKMGYDFNDYVGAELQLSNGYVSSSAPSAADIPGAPGGSIINYSLFNVSVLAVGAFYPIERLSLEPKVGGGIAILSPGPSAPNANSPEDVAGGTAPHLVFGLDIKYLTLLTDFSAGLSLNGYVYFMPGGIAAVIAFAPAFVVRYTF